MSANAMERASSIAAVTCTCHHLARYAWLITFPQSLMWGRAAHIKDWHWVQSKQYRLPGHDGPCFPCWCLAFTLRQHIPNPTSCLYSECIAEQTIVPFSLLQVL